MIRLWREHPARVLLPLIAALLALTVAACSRGNDEVIYITATPLRDADGNVILPPTMTPDSPTDTPIVPTPNPTRERPPDTGLYAVQAGDTLFSIAEKYGLTLEELLNANDLPNASVLEVGQLLTIPGGSLVYGPDFKIIPDSELVYGPTASDFSIAGAVKFQQGFLKAYSQSVGGTILTGVEIVDFIATNYSVNPRLLLALLEYRGGWLTQPYPNEPYIDYPLGIIKSGSDGLYEQLLEAANALNYGYYGWKYRGTTSLVIGAGQRVFYAPGLNPGTVGVQYMLSLTVEPDQWQRDIHPEGFFATYTALFGDPFARAYEPITPPDLAQPALTLPIPRGEEWVYTGGPHGAYNSGSAWGAIDLAPPDPPDELRQTQGACYLSPNFVTAAAPGMVVRSGAGYVVLDLDMDGNEHTGWTLVHLHIDDYQRIEEGTVVQAGDRLGHPSCEGGFSTGTHLHFARRYNGEWIPVECEECAPGVTVPPLVLGEWTVHAFSGQEYQGYMTRPTEEDNYRQAEQTREYAFNKLVWN